MTTETVIRHDDGSVTVERELFAGVKVGATDPLGSLYHAQRAAYAAEVALRDRIRQVGIITALTEAQGTCRQPIRYGSDVLCDRPRGHDQQHAVHPSRVSASGPGHVTGIDRPESEVQA